ncbi:MAG: T9SS type A sorting domain-containing protein [Bacteroidota bacterium]
MIAALWLFSWNLDAQQNGGWERYFGEPTLSETVTSVIQTQDGGYLVAGEIEGSLRRIYLLRTDIDGTKIWDRIIGRQVAGVDESISATDILEAEDGTFVLLGTTAGQGSLKDFYLAKYSQDGDRLWERTYGQGSDDVAAAMAETADGGYLLVGTQEDGTGGDNEEIFVVKTDRDGNVEFSKVPSEQPGSDEVARGVVPTSDGGFIITGSMDDGGPSDAEAYILKIDAAGDSSWSQRLGGNDNDVFNSATELNNGSIIAVGSIGNDIYLASFTADGTPINSRELDLASTFTEFASDVLALEDGTAVAVGARETTTIESKGFLAKIDQNVNVLWFEEYGRPNYGNSLFSIDEKEGGFILAGISRGPFLNLLNDAFLVNASSEGLVFTNYIEGLVYNDADNGCDLDMNEEGLDGWVVSATNTATNDTYYGTSDADGRYSILVPEGSYNVETTAANAYWKSCTESFNINFTTAYDTIRRNFGINADIVCPDLEIDVSTAFLIACEESSYTVSYCNNGTAQADQAEAHIILDDDLSFVSSSPISPKTVNDSLYTFDLGDLDQGQCGQFVITVDADCDAVLQQSHCLKASITPDEICVPPTPSWDGSSLTVDGYCDGDSLRFFIENRGSRTTESSRNWIVIEDQIMFRQGNVPSQLSPNAVQAISLEATGSTYRLSAEQSQGHPGNSTPTVAIEGCTTDGSFTVGFLNQFEEDDRDVFRSVDCQENLDISTYGPYFKRGYPKGYGEDAEITPETDLKYIINFQNVGTDTAIRVVIRDTLSSFLDPTSVRAGASSHDYTLEVYGGGILKFTFENIRLPASSTNEDASYGFVKYRISQKPDTPDGSRIKNGAAVFFDYQIPGYTGQVCHTVKDSLGLLVSIDNIFTPEVSDIKVYPNPFTHQTTVEVVSERVFQQLDLSIFDASGRLIRRERFDSMKFELQRASLASGLYLYKLETDGLLISSGKLLVQ